MDSKNYGETVRARKHFKLWCIIVIAALLAVFIAACISVFVDYLEIVEIGENFAPAFLKNLVVKYSFGALGFVFVFLITLISTLVLRKNLFKANVSHSFLKSNLVILAICAAFSFFAAGFISVNMHEEFLLFMNAGSFGETDPIFFRDIGYYVFSRLFLYMLIESITAIIAVLTLYVAAMYFLLYIKIGERNVVDLVHDKKVILHIAVNVILYMLAKTASIWIMAQGILFSEFAGVVGSGFTQTNITLNYYRALPFIMLAIVAFIIVFLFKGKPKAALIAFASYFAVTLGVNIIEIAVDTFYVSPNEVAVEEKYLENNIKYTRMAYGLDDVTEVEYPYKSNNVSFDSESDATIENIRIIDFGATLTATNQLQGIRNYYKFKDLDVGVYNINGKEQAVAIGVREIEKDNIDDSAKNYINEKFRYTHGYGVVMASFNTVDSQGQPNYFIKDINGEQKDGVPKVTQPRVYFGEISDDSVIVNTKTRELDYSEGTTDKEFDYDGKAGIKLNFLNRAIFAVKTGDFRMLVANQITPESRLLINRNVYERVKKAAPFIKFDPDVHIVIDDDGSLKWIVDGYTVTNQFPYAQYTDGFNYIRNSVKAVVDAYNGTVKLYIIDKDDPIINVYSRIYPSVFEKDDIPESIMSKTKYPEWLFNIQSQMFTQYHTQSPTVFYNKNDMYAIANEKYSNDVKPIEPYYNIMQLDEFGEKPELLLMLPYTLYNRENMTSWIAAGNKGESYGKLVSYKFPKDLNIYGPLQIENIIDNNPDISREMTLWNSGGSNVIRGNLLVIPVADTVLYVEPVYLTTDNQASLPSLKRVIAVYGDKIAMEETLEEALEKVLAGGLTSENSVIAPDPPEQIEEETPIPEDETTEQRIVRQYRELEGYAKNGEWAKFGTALEEMEETIIKIEESFK